MDELEKRASILLEKNNISEKKSRFKEIEIASAEPTFWNDSQKATEVMQEMGKLQKQIEDFETLKLFVGGESVPGVESIIESLEVGLYLSGPYDKGNAILSVHAGQGGVDAMDFAKMLSRMYQRYAERKGFKIETIDESTGEEAGIKNVTFLIEGEFAYGFLKNESGTHRLVRLSPFNANNLRQTSFALVEVLPQVEESSYALNDDDLEWDFYRASSHGGQNVQKVSSAVRLKHKPTGIVVTCQTERYQNQNREYALKLLKAKLAKLDEEKRIEAEQKLKGEYKQASWGNQIRNYVLHPYQLVKDVRTNVETSNTQGVLDGEIDIFIDAALKEGDS